MEKPKIQNGLVGFFDILGYQSFLENNDVEIATSEVLNILNNIPTIVTSALMDPMIIPHEDNKSGVENIQWLLFSDTILMAMEWDGSLYDWFNFTLAAIRLCREMFDFGLPLRGAIKNGRYVISRSCFAGRVIVDAYRAEKRLNLAGCSIDETLIHQLKDRDKEVAELVERIVVEYMTPLVDGEYQELSLLHFLTKHGDLPKTNPVHIPQLVLNSFWAHRKHITANAEIKARNTENFLRFLFNRFPVDFADA